jgi:hypothetical protein
MVGPRQYTPATMKKLWGFSGMRCYSPECNSLLLAKDHTTLIGYIAHIEAAEKNGPRFRMEMKNEDRRSFNNLILLCDECHKIIDNKVNEAVYPVALLQKWKNSCESKVLSEKINSKPSLLKDAVISLSNYDFDGTVNNIDAINAFDIQEKIDYNNLRRNRFIIEEQKVYHGRINKIYEELEMQGSFRKEKLLRNIKRIYLKVKGELSVSNEISAIRDVADDIFEGVEEMLNEELKVHLTDAFVEDISFGVSLIMIHAFMDCKILEEPLEVA